MKGQDRELLHQNLHCIADFLSLGHRTPAKALPPAPEVLDCQDKSLLIILVPQQDSSCAAAQELLAKMIGAINIDIEKDCTIAEGFSIPPFTGCPGPRGIIIADKTASKSLSPGPNNVPIVQIHHPAQILKDDGLKRPTWEALKLLAAGMAKNANNAANDGGQ